MKKRIIRHLHYWAVKTETALDYWRMDGNFAAARQGWKDVDLLGFWREVDDPLEADLLADVQAG